MTSITIKKTKRQKINKTKQNFDQGYRLHKERIKKISDGKSAPIRSIKFPLVTKDQELFNIFFEAIKHDYQFMVGSMNFVNWSPHQTEPANLLQLWKTAIQNGVVIARKGAIASKFYSLINSSNLMTEKIDNYAQFTQDTGLQLCLPGLEQEWFVDQRKRLSLEGLILVVYKSSLDFAKLDKKQQTQIKSDTDIPQDILLNLRKIIQPIWEANSAAIPPAKVYTKTKKDLITQYQLDTDKAASLGRSFFLHARLKSQSLEDALDRFDLELRELNNKTAYDEKDILGGLNSKMEGLSSFFGFLDTDKSLPEDMPEVLRSLVTALIKNKSKLVKPAEYRSQVGGILASYVTNYFKRKSELQDEQDEDKKSKANLKRNLSELEIFLKDELNNGSIDLETFDYGAIKQSISELKQWFEQYQKMTSDEIFNILEFELSDLKSSLNKIIFIDEELGGSNHKKTKKQQKSGKERLNELLGKLQVARPVHFPGETKKEQFMRFYYAHETFSRLLNFYRNECHCQFEINCNSDFKEISKKYRQILDTLWTKYPELSTRFQHIIKSYFSKYIPITDIDGQEICQRLKMNVFDLDKFLNSQDLDSMRSLRFYANPRSRQKSRELFLENVSKEQLLSLYNHLKPNWDDILQAFEQEFDSRLEDLVSAVELEKIRSGIKYFLAGENYLIDSAPYHQNFTKEVFPRDKYLDLKLFDELLKDSKPITGKIEQMLLTALRAKLAFMSRKEELARYVVNPLETEKKFPLIWRTLNDQEKQDCEHHRKNKRNRHSVRQYSYSISLDQWLGVGSHGNITNALCFDKNSSSFETDTKNSYAKILDIQSSVYQTQFLERLAESSITGSSAKGWEDMNITMSSYSFIAEETYSVQWFKAESGFRYPKLDFVNGSRRIFASMPFGLKPKKSTENHLSASNRYLGVDVGEYGLAYSVIETNGDENKDYAKSKSSNPEGISISCIASGFIHSHLIHKIKDQYRENQKIQRTATFSRPNTKLAYIRDNVIGSLRNRVHHLVLRYQAIPVYEFEISNFETGSGKVTKIYDSVKRSDPYKTQDVEKKLRQHIWGTKAGIGREVGAFATSYTCVNCGSSHYDIDFGVNKKDSSKPLFSLKRVVDEEYELYIQDTTAYRVSMFLREYDSSKLYSKDEITRAIKDWARPPQEYQEVSDVHKDIRGNSSVYRCPFCKVTTDADIQASLNIALLGYISNTGDSKKGEKEVDDLEKEEWRKLRRSKLLSLIQSQKNLVDQGALAFKFQKQGLDYDGYISA